MVTLLDRLAGIQRVDPYVAFTLTQYFDVEGTAIDWRNRRLSPLARQVGASFFTPDRQFMIDRLYLGVMFYSTVLRRLPANSDAQSVLFNRVVSVGDALTRHEVDGDALPHPRVEAVAPTSTPTLHVVHVVLYMGPNGRLAIREYPLRNGRGWWVAPLCVLGSLVDACNEREREFLGYWLQGMAEFYKRQEAPNAAASAVPVTENGLSYAVEEVLTRIVAALEPARGTSGDRGKRRPRRLRKAGTADHD
ncbi:MAG TPA: hypothetical protein VFN57_08395 [Thermomicrobiaceae bacterium]|nr:hypothetical protein [Thermomicrobiaceae bacterium]